VAKLSQRGGTAPGVEAREALEPRLKRHHSRATIADDVRGHALHDLERHRGIEQDGEVVVRVHVDEAGADGEARRVDLRGPARGDRSHADDAITADGDVCADAGAAGAVVNGPPANHEVERRRVGHGMSGIDGSADERSEDQGRYCYGRRVVVKATSELACGRIARGGSTA